MTLLTDATPVFYLTVTDHARAIGFYRDTLGQTLLREDEHGAFLDLGGALLRVTPMADHQASPHPVVGWDVRDIRAAVAGLNAKGVACIVYDGFGQDELGVWTSPDGGTKLAWFADPDGNVLTVSQIQLVED